MKRLNPLLSCWLHTWGTCQRRRIGLEYPTMTAEARMFCSPGLSTLQNRSPSYEPDAIDIAVNNAVMRLKNREYALLLIARYIEQKSYCEIKREIRATSEWAARWQLEKAIREVASELHIQAYC